MTIIETANNPDPAIDGVILPEGWPAKDMAYTIHAESAVNSYGRSLKVIGCRLVNANRPCIGAGTYNNYSIELIDTEYIPELEFMKNIREEQCMSTQKQMERARLKL